MSRNYSIWTYYLLIFMNHMTVLFIEKSLKKYLTVRLMTELVVYFTKKFFPKFSALSIHPKVFKYGSTFCAMWHSLHRKIGHLNGPSTLSFYFRVLWNFMFWHKLFFLFKCVPNCIYCFYFICLVLKKLLVIIVRVN